MRVNIWTFLAFMSRLSKKDALLQSIEIREDITETIQSLAYKYKDTWIFSFSTVCCFFLMTLSSWFGKWTKKGKASKQKWSHLFITSKPLLFSYSCWETFHFFLFLVPVILIIIVFLLMMKPKKTTEWADKTSSITYSKRRSSFPQSFKFDAWLYIHGIFHCLVLFLCFLLSRIFSPQAKLPNNMIPHFSLLESKRWWWCFLFFLFQLPQQVNVDDAAMV